MSIPHIGFCSPRFPAGEHGPRLTPYKAGDNHDIHRLAAAAAFAVLSLRASQPNRRNRMCRLGIKLAGMPSTPAYRSRNSAVNTALTERFMTKTAPSEGLSRTAWQRSKCTQLRGYLAGSRTVKGCLGMSRFISPRLRDTPVHAPAIVRP
jgi:hypothetical protein